MTQAAFLSSFQTPPPLLLNQIPLGGFPGPIEEHGYDDDRVDWLAGFVLYPPPLVLSLPDTLALAPPGDPMGGVASDPGGSLSMAIIVFNL